MEIGAKIKNARSDAQLTQEQAANALGSAIRLIKNKIRNKHSEN